MLALNVIASKYYDAGLRIFGYPCDQFKDHAPGTADEFIRTLYYIRPGDNYTAKFMLMNMVQVNGATEDHVYTYLKGECPIIPTYQMMVSALHISWTPLKSSDIIWNFAKFLIDRNGIPYRRYYPTDFIENMIDDIEFLLNEKEE